VKLYYTTKQGSLALWLILV
jgi:hypothetical protein